MSPVVGPREIRRRAERVPLHRGRKISCLPGRMRHDAVGHKTKKPHRSRRSKAAGPEQRRGRFLDDNNFRKHVYSLAKEFFHAAAGAQILTRSRGYATPDYQSSGSFCNTSAVSWFSRRPRCSGDCPDFHGKENDARRISLAAAKIGTVPLAPRVRNRSIFSAHRWSEKHVFSAKNGPVPRQPVSPAKRQFAIRSLRAGAIAEAARQSYDMTNAKHDE